MLLSNLLNYDDRYISDNTVFYIRRNSAFIAEGTRCNDVVRQYSDCIVADFFFNPAVGVDSIFIILK